MDLLDRLLGHDAWTTRQLLLRCRELTDEQLDRRFDIGDRSLRETFVHIIENMEDWTDRMAMRPDRTTYISVASSPSENTNWFRRSATGWAAAAILATASVSSAENRSDLASNGAASTAM